MDPMLQQAIQAAQVTGAPLDLESGWIHDPDEVGRQLATMPKPLFGSAAPWLQGSGAGKTSLLYKAWKDVNGGSYIDYVAQAIGDCFPAGTSIWMGDSARKPIEEIKVGDRVATAEGNVGEVTQLFRRPAREFLVVKDHIGREVCCTPEHPFRTKRGYVLAKDLRPEDEVAVFGYTHAITQWQAVDVYPVANHPEQTVYNFEVGGDNSYIANEFGVHNCVSHAYAHGVDLLAAVEIVVGKEPEEFKETSTEAVYGICRVDVGGQRGSRSDGAVGAWAAKAVTTYGTVSREVVGPYSGQRAKDWGARGVPDEIKAKAVDHKVKTTSLVSTLDELDDALANGYPVPVCSNQGFTLQRDANGFCRPKGRWAHAMLFCAARADSTPGYCILQSWGSQMPSGPLTLDQPPNSFWVDRDVAASMLGMRDSFALSAFDGYPSRVLPQSWSYDDFA